MFKITKLLILNILLLFFSSCKNQIFLKRKYFTGSYFNTIKKSKPTIIHCCAETKRQTANTSNVNNHYAYQILTNTPLITKSVTSKHSIDNFTKPIKHGSSPSNSKEILNKSKKSPKHLLKKDTSSILKLENNKDSTSLFYIKTILLFLLFWGVLIVLYSSNIAIQLASFILILKILGYIVLAAIIWLLFFLIFTQLKKNTKA